MIEKTSIEKARESRALVEEQLTMRAFEVRRFKKRSTKFQRLDLEDNCFFFRAQAVEEALRKDRDCPVEKETPKRRGASGLNEAQPPPPDVESWLSSQC